MELTLGQINCLLRAGETESNRLIVEIEDFQELCQQNSVVEAEKVVLFAHRVLDLESLSLAMADLADGLASPEKKKTIKEVATGNADKAKELLTAFEIEADDQRSDVIGILTLFPKEMLSDVTEQGESVLESEIDVFLN